jgi:hypothetical protein
MSGEIRKARDYDKLIAKHDALVAELIATKAERDRYREAMPKPAAAVEAPPEPAAPMKPAPKPRETRHVFSGGKWKLA